MIVMSLFKLNESTPLKSSFTDKLYNHAFDLFNGTHTTNALNPKKLSKQDKVAREIIYNGRYEPPPEKEEDGNNENKSEVSEMSVFTHRFFQISEEPEAKKTIQNDSSETSAQSLNVGLGKAHADGNHLDQIKVNNFDHKNDANFIGDGDDPATNKINIPAILAARTAGGDPDPKTVDNGVNKISNDVFKLKKLRDDEY